MAKRKAAPKKPGGNRKRVVDAEQGQTAKRKTAKRKTTTTKRAKAKPSAKKRRAAKRKTAKATKAATAKVEAQKDTGADGTPASGGGRGESALTDPARGEMRRSDMATIGAAIRNRRVNVRDDAVEACLNRAARIGLSTTKERNALAATRLLLTAVQINQADEHKGLPDKIQVDARVMTVEGQRAALLTAIAAEKQRRARKAK